MKKIWKKKKIPKKASKSYTFFLNSTQCDRSFFMWVCSLKCYGPLAILLLWIYVYPLVGRVGDASPDSITDIKIRKADQIPLGKVHFWGKKWELPTYMELSSGLLHTIILHTYYLGFTKKIELIFLKCSIITL